MELTYQVRGADGKEYGPLQLSQLITWVRENRVGPESELMRSDMTYWSPASSFAELKEVFTPSTPPPITGTTSAPGTTDTVALAQVKSGASWFYWIAALSLVNSIVAFTGSDWRFIIGLGVTQIIDALGHEGGGKFVALALDLMAAGVLVLFGVFGSKGHLWAFIVGMVLFALDGVIFLLVQDWIGVAFHAFVLYCLFRGFQGCRALKAS